MLTISARDISSIPMIDINRNQCKIKEILGRLTKTDAS